MAKKQTYGDKALQAKMGQRKMAKVIIANKKTMNSISYKESIIDQNDVKEFLAKHK